MALESLAHEAHHMTEHVAPKDKALPRSRKVNPQQNGIAKAVSGAIQGALLYTAIGIASIVVLNFLTPAITAGAGIGLAELGAAFGFGQGAAGGFSLAHAGMQLVGLPILGSLIKGVTGYLKGTKEAEEHNARLEGKTTSRGHGRGHAVEPGIVVAGVPGLAQEEAYHPAQEQRGSFVERYRPEGPVTGAEKIAAIVEAERAASNGQAV